MEKLIRCFLLLCVMINGIVWGLCDNREVHKQTTNKQTTQDLEKSYEIPKYLDSIPDYE